MRALLFVLLTAALAFPASADPIDRLVVNLSAASHGLWRNGLYPTLGLAEAASTEQLIGKVFEMTGCDRGHVTEFKIVESRQVRIPGDLPDLYRAVLVETNFGSKIVLLKHETGGWWSRVYDAP